MTRVLIDPNCVICKGRGTTLGMAARGAGVSVEVVRCTCVVSLPNLELPPAPARTVEVQP